MSSMKFTLACAAALAAGFLAAMEPVQIIRLNNGQEKIGVTPAAAPAVPQSVQADEELTENAKRSFDEMFKNRQCSAQELLSFSDFAVIRYLLETKKADPNMKFSGASGEEPLVVFACRRGNHRLARLLVEFGADCPDWPDAGISVLHAAALNGHLPLVQALLDAGLDPNALDQNGVNTLYYARTIPVLKLLIRSGASFNPSGVRGDNFLKSAIRDGNLELVKLLVEEYPRESGADDSAGLIPFAISSGSIPVTDYLFAVSGTKKASLELLLAAVDPRGFNMIRHLVQTKNAPLNELTPGGEGVLSRAVWNRDTFRRLVELGADPNNPAAHAMILCSAVFRNNLTQLSWLIETYKMNVNAAAPDGMTPLIAATRNQTIETIHFLLDKGAKPEGVVKNSGMTALSYACSRGLDDIVRRLLELGAKPDIVIADINVTPLQLAIQRRKISMLQLLLKHGADPNFYGKNTEPPIASVADVLSFPTQASNNAEICKLLLKHGADPNIILKASGVPLLVFAAKDNGEEWKKGLFKILLDCDRTKIDIRDAEGNTALHAAASLSPEVIGQLLKKGADVNVRNKQGNTPLHSILIENAEKLRNEPTPEYRNEINLWSLLRVNLLLKNGASPRMKNHAGKLPRDLTDNAELRKVLDPEKK